MVNWKPGVETIFLCERLWLNLSANVVHHCATLARQSIDWHKPEACAPSLWLMFTNTHSNSIMSEDLASIRSGAHIHITPGINVGLWLWTLYLICSYIVWRRWIFLLLIKVVLTTHPKMPTSSLFRMQIFFIKWDVQFCIKIQFSQCMWKFLTWC